MWLCGSLVWNTFKNAVENADPQGLKPALLASGGTAEAVP